MDFSLDGFPNYSNSNRANDKLDDLKDKTVSLYEKSKYIDIERAMGLSAKWLSSYKLVGQEDGWSESDFLGDMGNERRFSLSLAALFDLICNVEYLHNRMVNNKWTYCHRHREDAESTPVAYYAFLSQCPMCCLDQAKGLEGGSRGIFNPGHKPSSHHIGEITTSAVMLLMRILEEGATTPLSLAAISHQSHDVDAIAYKDDLLILFEIKASPLVTFPVRAHLPRPLTKSGPDEDGPIEYDQHEEISVDYQNYELDLYLPHINEAIPLSSQHGEGWPYESVTTWISRPDNFIKFFDAWAELFQAYRIPKTDRQGRDKRLGYLTNGWGDKVDSNKTKPGLCRTDDIKKGTYQMLKYGAYYRYKSDDLNIRGALLANLDPVFMREEYLTELIDAVWSKEENFSERGEEPDILEIRREKLSYLYDAVLAFNRPVFNDELLKGCFSVESSMTSLLDGHTDSLIEEWSQ